MTDNFDTLHPRSNDGTGRFAEKHQQDPGGGVLPDPQQLAADLRASVGDYRNPSTPEQERQAIAGWWASQGLVNQFAAMLEAARLAAGTFPTDRPVEPPEHGTPEYERHRQQFTDAVIAKLGGEVTNTGGGCTAIEKTLDHGCYMLIASDAVIPDGEDTFLGVYNDRGELYEQSETYLDGIQSVDEVVAAARDLEARFVAGRKRWTLA